MYLMNFAKEVLVISIISLFILLILLIVFSSAAMYQIKFSWDANTEPDLAGYKLYRSQESGVYPEQAFKIMPYDATSDIVENINFGIPQYFVITAFDQAGKESGYSNEVAFFPDPNDISDLPPEVPQSFDGDIQIIYNYY